MYLQSRSAEPIWNHGVSITTSFYFYVFLETIDRETYIVKDWLYGYLSCGFEKVFQGLGICDKKVEREEMDSIRSKNDTVLASYLMTIMDTHVLKAQKRFREDHLQKFKLIEY